MSRERVLTLRRLLTVIIVLVTIFLAFKWMNTMGPIRIIPEPTLNAIQSGAYSTDTAAMTSYYDALFQGKTVKEVVQLFQELGTQHKYISDHEIQVVAKKSFAPIPVGYFCAVTLSFDDGHFKKTTDVSMCGLIGA